MGRRHGHAIRSALDAALDTYVQGFVDAGLANRDDLASRREAWLASVPERYRLEMVGVAEGADVPLNALVDSIVASAYPVVECSSVLLFRDPHWWIAHNNDWYDFGSQAWTGMVARAVDGRIPHLTFGLQGDVCTVVGVNRERIWLHMNGYPAQDEPPAGGKPVLPYVFVIREALEVCTSLEDVAALLERWDRDSGMAIYAVDGKTEEAALFECGHATMVRRAPHHERAVISHSRDAGDRLRDGVPLAVIGSNATGRIDRMVDSLERSESDPLPDCLIRILADPQVEERGAEGLFKDPQSFTVYANVAAPGAGRVWFGHGAVPAASAGQWDAVAWPWPE